MGQRLFTKDVLARQERCFGDMIMPVIGGGNDDRIEVFFLGEQFAVVAIFGHVSKGEGRIYLGHLGLDVTDISSIHVAQCRHTYDFSAPERFFGADVALVAKADNGYVECLSSCVPGS